MTEIRLTLSYGALMALVRGDELAMELDVETQVSLRLDDDAMQTIQDNFRASVLAAMPVSPVAH